MSRRGKGEGSIFQRTDGRWVSVIEVGQDATGKRLRKSIYGKTKKAVADKLTKLAGQRLDGGITMAGKMTVGELLDRWLEDKARLEVAPTTYARYKSLTTTHIKPRLGKVKLSAMTTLHIQSLISNIESPETRRYCFQVIRTVFNVAKRWKIVNANPCDDIDPPKVTRREITPLSIEQAQSLLLASKDHRLSALFVLAIATGLRQGELFGLHRDDLDLEAGTLTVRHSLEEISGRLRLKAPKSKSGRRQVALPQIAVLAMETYLADHAIEGPALFTDSDGNFLRKSNFERRVWKPIRDAAGIPATVVFHDLRHTSASLLLKSGAHIKVVQERLGHSTIKLTLDTYSHLMDGMQTEAATKMHDAMTPTPDRLSIGCQTNQVGSDTVDANHCLGVA